MTEFITEAQLASYLQVDLVTGRNALTVQLANGLVTDLIGDPVGDGLLAELPSRVTAITLEAAARHARNPLAFSSEQVKTDDYDTTERREGKALTAPGVYLTEDEAAELVGLVGGVARRGRTGTIRLRVPDAS